MISPSAESKLLTLNSLERRLASNPASPLFARLASLYLDTNRLEEARELCERGTTHYPDYATAHLVLGQCYLRLQRFSDAKRELQHSLALQPKCNLARELLLKTTAAEEAQAAQRMPQRIGGEILTRGEEVETREERLFGGDIMSELATPTLAEIYATQGAYQEAIKTYSLLLHRRPEDRERFEQRIRELEDKRRALEPPS